MKNKQFIYITIIVLGLAISASAAANPTIPNGGFEFYETVTIASTGFCSGSTQTISRPQGWESWYDDWCDTGQGEFCQPCGWLTCRTTTQDARSGNRSLRINAINRNMWWEGTAQTIITHDGGELPSKFMGYYKKFGGSWDQTHYLDPEVIFLRAGADLDNFLGCYQMASGCNVDENDILVAVREPGGSGDEIPNCGTTDQWTYFERDIPVLEPQLADQVETIIVRFHHYAASTSDYVLVDDIRFDFASEPSLCELDFDNDRDVDLDDLQASSFGGIYWAAFVYVYYPGYFSIFFPGLDSSELDWNGDSSVDMDEIYPGPPTYDNLDTYHTQWHVFMLYPDYYPLLYPNSGCQSKSYSC